MQFSVSPVCVLTLVFAGIAGLATAFALARSGHRVRVFDKLDGSRQVFLSLSNPSPALILLIKAVRRCAHPPKSI